MSTPKKVQCANVKSRRSQNERCLYTTTSGEFCSRHSKKPHRFQTKRAIMTRSLSEPAIKIQKFWRFHNSKRLRKERGLAFFNRDLCHNDTELASLEPVKNISRDYFFAIHEANRYWGFDIRTLLIQYESEGKLENPYTKEECSAKTLERFRKHIHNLRLWKKGLQYEQMNSLNPRQSWNLRVLDMCLRLDMLGYRVATNWFTDLDLPQHKNLYSILYGMWNETLNLTEQQKQVIIPNFSDTFSLLFKWHPSKVLTRRDIDTVRRTNLNIMERFISSAIQQSDRTLGAMYVVMALTQVSYKCRNAYPWLV